MRSKIKRPSRREAGAVHGTRFGRHSAEASRGGLASRTALQCRLAALAGADPGRAVERRDEDHAGTRLSGSCREGNEADHGVAKTVGYRHLDLESRNEPRVSPAPVNVV